MEVPLLGFVLTHNSHTHLSCNAVRLQKWLKKDQDTNGGVVVGLREAYQFRVLAAASNSKLYLLLVSPSQAAAPSQGEGKTTGPRARQH